MEWRSCSAVVFGCFYSVGERSCCGCVIDALIGGCGKLVAQVLLVVWWGA
jgi:hypothetical protein